MIKFSNRLKILKTLYHGFMYDIYLCEEPSSKGNRVLISFYIIEFKKIFRIVIQSFENPNLLVLDSSYI